MQQPQSFSFTKVSNSRENVLLSECQVSESWNPDSGEPHPSLESFTAIWDTGATRSVITQAVVDKCKLAQVGIATVHHSQGKEEEVPVFLINIVLPNSVLIPELKVTRGGFIGGDVLVGMDIITMGDFAVTNLNGRTKFTFRIPSQADIDFVAEQRRNSI